MKYLLCILMLSSGLVFADCAGQSCQEGTCGSGYTCLGGICESNSEQ